MLQPYVRTQVCLLVSVAEPLLGVCWKTREGEPEEGITKVTTSEGQVYALAKMFGIYGLGLSAMTKGPGTTPRTATN